MSQTHDLAAMRERLDFIGLDAAAKERLNSLKEVIAASIGDALDEFYKKVRTTPQTHAMFSNEQHLQGAKQRQERHWVLIADAEFDERYIDGISKVGKVHARLGLEPRWYIGGYALIIEQLIGSVIAARWPSMFGRKNAAALAQDVSTVVKAALLDMDYGVSIYLEELAEARRKAEDEKQKAETDQRAALALLAEALNELAGGNLESRLTAELPPEFVEMAGNFNSAAASLHEAIADVRTTSAAIMSGTEGIAMASDDLSRRTEQQAASLEESSAALHELSESVRMTADNAAQASHVVSATQSEASQSEKVVADAVAAMGKIKGSSEEIAAIIGVIDEIAFQTNLLALNAGVEAARAGDAGRGFAVVAQEVRSLAQRCASSAKEIKDLISTSSDQVESGVSLVGAAGEALASMIGRINEINHLMNGIASAAAEQSQGIAEVNTAVSQMDQITQKNAAMVEETSAETQRLKDEAFELAAKLKRFRIDAQKVEAARLIAGPRKLSPAAHATTGRTAVSFVRHAAARVGGGAAVAVKSEPVHDNGWEEF
ncbi:globin-coupled sensor protein [Aquamicrobium sp.]|uniref:globin-coupled sensor protein n=1 Tax=Aquamicrobium sp. TaxID=1872579 RepID=UPI00258B56F6|nr:globin-coupled sensor protein [Aquamicrobium sp.]MCK9550473.1 methyl-accepting chemotaxis protein [Aquamicrobium sp.]